MIQPDNADSPYSDGDIRSKVLCDLRDREVWARRQATWYAMRHDGLRRANKPWPWAADLHFPLADMQIEKLKPFYFNQMFSTQTVASFVPTSPDMQPVCSEVGNYFDYKVKQESNAETEILVAIDRMLMAGMDCVIVRWDNEDSRLAFDAIEPSHIIVPQWTKELEKSDRVSIVRIISVEQYKRDPKFTNKDASFISQIQGRGAGVDGTNEWLEQLKLTREGQSYFDFKDQIVYWEIWEKCGPGDEETDSEDPETEAETVEDPQPAVPKPEEPSAQDNEKPYWKIHFLSPYTDDELRPSMRNPFKHGKLPIVRFQVEVKDNDHYSSRGIPERIGAFETAATKQWNEKNDFMTLTCRPLFNSDSPIPNTGNIKFIPGQIAGEKLSKIDLGPVPAAFEEEMNYQRSVAEELCGVPDFGQGAQDNVHDARTATEVQNIAQVMNVGVDLKARTFRSSLGQLYNLAWATLLQYDEEASYMVEQTMATLKPETLAQLKENPDLLKVVANGSGDSWNRAAQIQKAIQRKKLFENSPWIDQQEIDKSIVELDDPRLIPRLFKQNEYGVHEYQDEAEQIPVMLLGFPMQVEPDEDHAIRIKCIADFMQQRAHIGAPPDPIGQPILEQHIAQHMQALQQQDPKKARQVAAGLKQMQQQMMQQPPQNVLPMPGQGAPAQGQGQQQPPAQDNADSPQQVQAKILESMKYADAPPDVQREMERKAGFTPSHFGGSSQLEQTLADKHQPPQPPQMPPGNQAEA